MPQKEEIYILLHYFMWKSIQFYAILKDNIINIQFQGNL